MLGARFPCLLSAQGARRAVPRPDTTEMPWETLVFAQWQTAAW